MSNALDRTGARTPGPRSVVIVDEADDAFAEAFCRYARARGADAKRVRLAQFAREVTIVLDEDGARVTPCASLLLRPIRALGSRSAEERRFMWAEEFAAVWSAAALSKFPVMNRPGEWGWASHAGFSAAVTDRRAGRAESPPEAFWHGSPPPEPGFELHQDLETWAIEGKPRNDRFIRSRKLPPMRGWDQVVVVAGDAFRATDAHLGTYEIEDASRTAAWALALDFATVSWGVPADGSAPILTRINPFPFMNECLPVLRPVCEALLGRLLT